jgi:hypothetical protein
MKPSELHVNNCGFFYDDSCVTVPVQLTGAMHLLKILFKTATFRVYAPRQNWDSPQPPTRRLVCPLPPVSGGRGTLAGEKGVGRVPIPTRGIHCGTLYMYILCETYYSVREGVSWIR